MYNDGDKQQTKKNDLANAASSSRVRSSLSWFGSRSRNIDPQIQALVSALRANHPKANIDLVQRAFKTAEKCHLGQYRKSGEPYITHPVAVATILAEIGMTSTTLAAALLHDTVEDTDYSLDELKTDFGDEIALLVDGVTKLDKVNYGQAAAAETVRKMIVAMSRDIRVLVIKLGDRLHNARTWKYVSRESAARKARETLEIFAPLAHRLGMNTVKWELEDLAFKTLYPEVYEEIDNLVAQRAPGREKYLNEVINQIKADLRTNHIAGIVSGRPKHQYSIYQKMIVRGRDFDDIYDLVGVRVLVDTIRDCYAVLGAMHARWNPIPGRFKDYIAMPKFNLYQSLHTTVVGPGGKPVEIQIRTKEMHHRAEYGVAAHWRYKENPNAPAGTVNGKTILEDDSELGWLRQLVDWQRETEDPDEFLDSLRYEISGAQVYVFTPAGEVKELTANATPVDFAFAIHTEVGCRTVGAKVNGKLVPLDTRLQNGDTVEVLTSRSPNAGPSQDWLNFVASARARNKIKSWFSKERREEAIERGQQLIAQAMRKQNLPLQRLMSHDSMQAVALDLGLPDINGLYAAVGEKHISAANVVAQVVTEAGGESGAEESLSEAITPGYAQTGKLRSPEEMGSGIRVAGLGEGEVWTKIAHCCNPLPGDDIIGFVTRGQGVSVHRVECNNALRLRQFPERIVEVSWLDHVTSKFQVEVEIKALDRAGLINDVTRILSDYHANILSASMNTSRDRVAISRYTFEIAEARYLNAILADVRKVPGVFSANRTSNDSSSRKHSKANTRHSSE